MFEYFYPGASARLIALWNGLDVSSRMSHPLMGALARPFGLTNYLAPVLGVLAAVGVCWLVARIVRACTVGEDTAGDAKLSGRVAGVTATVVFLLSSATLSAATHVEPALFGVVAALVAAVSLVGALAVRSALVYALLFVSGLLFGFFAGECPVNSVGAALAAPVVFWCVLKRRDAFRGAAAAAFLSFGFAAGFVAYTGIFAPDLTTSLVEAKYGLLGQISLADGGGARAVFALLPFLATCFLLPRAFGDGARLRRTTLGHVAVIPLLAFGLFSDFTAASVASAALLAFACGETLAYFIVTARADFRNRPAAGTRFRNVRFVSRYSMAGVLAVFAVLACVRALVTVDRSYAFADRLAQKVLDGLGTRTWLVTDGRLDDHLRIQAARRGQSVVLINVSRDLEKEARDAVAKAVRERLGKRAPDLVRSLDLGFLPFLEDWLKADPAAAKSVAVMAAPDILFACGVTPVPEVFTFGADPDAAADWSVWPQLAELLPAPKGWGSARVHTVREPFARFQLEYRRHLGLVANNRGVWLEDHGDRDGAFKLYSLVLEEIDADNVSALFNMMELADAGYKPAVARLSDLKRRVKEIVADESRRYRLWALANYYGTIRDVRALLDLGYGWARSGRPGEALQQIRRAADLVPSTQRSALMNMMAALLADADQRQASRQIYERRLAEKTDDHEALIGLVRLELLDGDEKKAQAYLERAVAAGGDDPRVRIELALLAMMKGDQARAREILLAVTTADPKNLKAWSMLSAVTMQLSDAAKDPAVRAKFDEELEKKILPTMETHARGADTYYVQSTRAFIAIRKGAAGRKAARDALYAAVQARPDVQVTREMLLGCDIALNDPGAAEAHARQTLRIDRASPMANYVMGSLALGKDDLEGAVAYLRKAVACKTPSAFALNDFAEALRLQGSFDEAEVYARRVVKDFPGLYAGWDTLACILIDKKGNADEALKAASKGVELGTASGRVQDPGLLITLARAQSAKGDRKLFNMTMRKLESRVSELNDRQKKLYEQIRK